jgi:IS605 OrfB family transposase
VEIKTTSTPLTKAMTFLARYGSVDTPEFVKRKIESEIGDKKAFYQTLDAVIEKFGIERLLNLARSKRERILQKYNHPIVFSSLSYRSALQSKDPLIQNAENKSFCNAFVSIPGFNGHHMFVPTSFSTDHHGHLNQYKTQEYTVCIEQKRKRVRIITTKDVREEVPLPEKHNYIGVDTNVKHNLFTTSEATEIDLDRDLFSGYISFLKKFQSKKDHTFGEEKQFELWQERISCMLKKKARELVDNAIANGKDHIIMEELSSFGKSFARSEEFEEFKYSRIVRLLNLSSLNKIVKGICRRLGVRLTLIPPHYTSQWCFVCGHIDRKNRPTQETFSCTCCGYTAPADLHSSQAIFLIGSSDVLKSSMLVKDKSSNWVPKRLSKASIRKKLEDITTESTFQLAVSFCRI